LICFLLYFQKNHRGWQEKIPFYQTTIDRKNFSETQEINFFFEKLLSLTQCKLDWQISVFKNNSRKNWNGRPNLQKWGPQGPTPKARGRFWRFRGSSGHRARVFWKGEIRTLDLKNAITKSRVRPSVLHIWSTLPAHNILKQFRWKARPFLSKDYFL